MNKFIATEQALMGTGAFAAHGPTVARQSPVDPLLDAVTTTRWHFALLCLYFATQAYTIPILPVGPWALWPGLPDFAALALMLAVGVKWQMGVRPTWANVQLFRLLLTLYALATFSFLLFRFLLTLQTGAMISDAGVRFGAYQLYRSLQVVILFWIAAHIPMTPKRLAVLRALLIAVLLFVCAGMIVSYTQLLPASAFVPQLPNDMAISGPWYMYHYYTKLNLPAQFGTISYNHSYIAAHVLLIFAFYAYLNQAQGKGQGSTSRHNDLIVTLLFTTAVLTIFLSESRAGLAGMLLLGLLYFCQRPLVLLIGTLASGLLLTVVLSGYFPISLTNYVDAQTIERSVTLLAPTNTENLSDRDTIWQERLQFLNEKPMRWVLGVGFGNAVNSGANAHMLPLHVILETGVVGLLAYSLCLYYILYALWRYDTKTRPLFWATVALLVSSVSQETFYPVASQLHFLGFYLMVVAIVLGRGMQPSANGNGNILWK